MPAKKKKTKVRIGKNEKKILKYLSNKRNGKYERDIREGTRKKDSVQRSINSLINKGLVDDEIAYISHKDKRYFTFSITKKGKELVNKLN